MIERLNEQDLAAARKMWRTPTGLPTDALWRSPEWIAEYVGCAVDNVLDVAANDASFPRPASLPGKGGTVALRWLQSDFERWFSAPQKRPPKARLLPLVRAELAPADAEVLDEDPPIPTALYRHFDEAGALLYVGISLSFVARLAQHRDHSHWFNQIRRVTVEMLHSRRAAERAERQAIATENPLHNVKRPRLRIIKAA